jgi:hypothetical protein
VGSVAIGVISSSRSRYSISGAQAGDKNVHQCRRN